jgi:hypothetical protein
LTTKESDGQSRKLLGNFRLLRLLLFEDDIRAFWWPNWARLLTATESLELF